VTLLKISGVSRLNWNGAMDGKQSKGLCLTAKEISAVFHDPHWAAKFPPVMSTEQAAELLQVPVKTLYLWHQTGRLSGCCKRVGTPLRFFRDRLLDVVFNQGF